MKTLLLCAAFFMLVTTVQAKTVTCTITGIKEQIVTLECKGKAMPLKTGQKVKVKTKEIEGC